MSIYWLVCASTSEGVADAEARGWTRIARTRFATPAKNDVRIVSRFVDLVPNAGVTRLIKGRDFPPDPHEIDGRCRDCRGSGKTWRQVLHPPRTRAAAVWENPVACGRCNGSGHDPEPSGRRWPQMDAFARFAESYAGAWVEAPA